MGFASKSTPEVTQLIRDREGASDPTTKRQLGTKVVLKRAEFKKTLRTEVLDRAAAGDYQVISFSEEEAKLVSIPARIQPAMRGAHGPPWEDSNPSTG